MKGGAALAAPGASQQPDRALKHGDARNSRNARKFKGSVHYLDKNLEDWKEQKNVKALSSTEGFSCLK